MQMGASAEKGCKGDPLIGNNRAQKILHLVSLTAKKATKRYKFFL